MEFNLYLPIKTVHWALKPGVDSFCAQCFVPIWKDQTRYRLGGNDYCEQHGGRPYSEQVHQLGLMEEMKNAS